MTDILNDVKRRHDFILLFDVQDGNPNGDPDAGNLPRVDPETMNGLVTDVCIKRKVRNFVDLMRGSEERYKIYVQNKDALNTLHQRAYTAMRLKSTGSKQKRDEVAKVQKWMCDNFFDIRTFGAVMGLSVNCGQVRGPLQLTFGRSLDPVVPSEIAITRIAITRAEDMDYVAAEGEQKEKGGKVTEMGRKAIVPYEDGALSVRCRSCGDIDTGQPQSLSCEWLLVGQMPRVPGGQGVLGAGWALPLRDSRARVASHHQPTLPFGLIALALRAIGTGTAGALPEPGGQASRYYLSVRSG